MKQLSSSNNKNKNCLTNENRSMYILMWMMICQSSCVLNYFEWKVMKQTSARAATFSFSAQWQDAILNFTCHGERASEPDKPYKINLKLINWCIPNKPNKKKKSWPHQKSNQSTSFSLIAEMLKEFGEEDLFDVDNEILVVEVCLGIIL